MLAVLRVRCVHACMRACLHVCMYVCVRAFVYVCVRSCKRVCAHVPRKNIQKFLHMYIYTHTHTHTHIRIHKHALTNIGAEAKEELVPHKIKVTSEWSKSFKKVILQGEPGKTATLEASASIEGFPEMEKATTTISFVTVCMFRCLCLCLYLCVFVCVCVCVYLCVLASVCVSAYIPARVSLYTSTCTFASCIVQAARMCGLGLYVCACLCIVCCSQYECVFFCVRACVRTCIYASVSTFSF